MLTRRYNDYGVGTGTGGIGAGQNFLLLFGAS